MNKNPYIIGYILPGENRVRLWNSNGIPANTADAVRSHVESDDYARDRVLNGSLIIVVSPRDVPNGGHVLGMTLYKVREVPAPVIEVEAWSA